MKRIGILGGMGAMAGAHFFQTLIESCQRAGAIADSDFPEVVVYSMSSKGMDETGVRTPQIFQRDLLKGVDLLKRADCEVILIACNTAFVFIKELNAIAVDVRIVDMPALVVESANGSVLGALCSHTSRDVRLFGDEAIYPTDEEQLKLDQVIGRCISGKESEPDKVIVLECIKSLRNRGAQKIVLGCTELPLAMMASYFQSVREDLIDPSKLAIENALTLCGMFS